MWNNKYKIIITYLEHWFLYFAAQDGYDWNYICAWICMHMWICIHYISGTHAVYVYLNVYKLTWD